MPGERLAPVVWVCVVPFAVALLPFQPAFAGLAEAVQEVALVVDQPRVDWVPWVTDEEEF